MPNRSRIHMLRVTAMRFEGNAPDAITKAIRGYAQELEARASDGRTGSAAEDKRIERQRALFAMLPSSNATDHLKEAMMQRAYDLMWDGAGQETDAILEFLPSSCSDEVFAAWENDMDGDNPKSRFH